MSYLALTPLPPKAIDLGWDKLNHAAAFSALTFVGFLSFPGGLSRNIMLALLMLAFGGLIEILQRYVPGRSCEWGDLLADSVGIVIGFVVAAMILHRLSTITPEPQSK